MRTELQCKDTDEGEACIGESDVKQVVNAPKTARKGYLANYNKAERLAIKETASEMGYSEEALDSALADVQ